MQDKNQSLILDSLVVSHILERDCHFNSFVAYMTMIVDIMTSSPLYGVCFFAYLTLIIGNSELVFSSSSDCSDSKFQYPQGIIPCKIYDETTLDCSSRMLVDIPPLEQNFTTKLDLSYNFLTDVKGTPFENLLVLRHLNLSHNNISNLSASVFLQLQDLEYLDLSDNRIRSLPDEIFISLSHLRHLNLELNFFTVIPPKTNYSNQLSLTYLNVRNNTSKSASFESGGVFKNLRSLESLFLNVNGLKSNITRNTFQYLITLPIQELEIVWSVQKYTKIDIEHGIVLSLLSLRRLIISYEVLATFTFTCPELRTMLLQLGEDGFEILDVSTLKVLSQWNSTLTHLEVSDTVVRILDYSFIWVSSLHTLDLSMNKIKHLSKDAFVGLKHLKKLNLADNYLNDVPSHSFHAFRSGSLQEIDLSHNEIRQNSLKNSFPWIDKLLKVVISSIEDWLDDQMNHVPENDDDDKEYRKKRYSHPSELEILQISDSTMIHFISESMCSLFPRLTHVTLSNAEFGIINFPSSLALNKCHRLNQLNLSDAIHSWNFTRTDIYLPNLQGLNVAGNKLNSVDQILFIKANLTYLDLSRNSLQIINNNDFVSFSSLVHLDLKGNSLTSIDGLQVLKFLLYLNVAGNQLTLSTSWMFFNNGSLSFPLEVLDLSKNPFQCTCGNKLFKRWILTDKKTHLIGDKYACASPMVVEGKSITATELGCKSKLGLFKGIGIPLVSFVILVLICVLLKYRWYIKNRVFRNYTIFLDVD